MFAFHAEPEAHHRGVHVDAVDDGFGEEIFFVQYDTGDARFTVVEGAHGVKGVRGAARASGNRGEGLRSRCIAVAEADADALPDDVLDQFQGAGHFRSQGHQANVAFSGSLKAVEGFDAGRKDVREWMYAAFCGAEKGAFQMDAERRGAVGGHGAGKVRRQRAEGLQGRVDGGTDRGRQEVRDSPVGEEAADGGHLRRVREHAVVTHGAVHVDVQEGRGKHIVGVVRRAGGDVEDAAIFHSQDGVLDAGVVGVEPARRKCLLHQWASCECEGVQAAPVFPSRP